MTTIWNRFPWLSLRLWRTHLRTKKHLLLCQKLFFNDISYLDDGVYNQVKEKLVLTVFGPARASTTLLATASKQPSSSFCSSRLFYYYLISNTGICIKMKVGAGSFKYRIFFCFDWTSASEWPNWAYLDWLCPVFSWQNTEPNW